MRPLDRRNTLPARIARLARKELKETLRDRRTIITLLLMPLLVYPLLSIAFQRFLLTTASGDSQPVYRLGFTNEEDAQSVLRYFALGDQILDSAGEDAADAATSADRYQLPNLDLFIVKNLKHSVARGEIDVGIRVTKRQSLAGLAPGVEALDSELLVQRNSNRSRQAASWMERRLAMTNQTFLEAQLAAAGNAGRVTPMLFSRVRVDAVGSPISFPLATLVPFVLILTTITGAVYPAIDLTAGERERGTLEILVAAPIPRFGLLLAKYAAVVAVAMLTAAVNCVAMTVTVQSIGLGSFMFGEQGLTFEVAISFTALLLLFAAFFSAVLLALTSFARSFKEAQAYLVPLMLASTAPGILSMLGGFRLTPILAVVPLVNMVLVSRDLFEHNLEPGLLLLVFASTLTYAGLALALAARLFGSDAALYGSPDMPYERPGKSGNGSAISLGVAMLTLASIVPPYILLGNWLSQAAEAGLYVRLGLAALLTIALFGAIPTAVAKWMKAPLVNVFALRWPGKLAVLGGVLLGVSLWPFAEELVLRMHQRGWFDLGAERMAGARQLIEQFRNVSPAWILLTMAATPALVEEYFFRGFLLGALRARQPGWAAVIVSAALFGAFHVVVTDRLLFERFLPTMLLGLVLGWLALRIASIWPGVALHAMHNGLLLLMARYKEELVDRGWGTAEQTHVPASWLITAGVVAGAGVLLLRWSGKAPAEESGTMAGPPFTKGC
jgi:ABC-2 type transport system permease protein/sodium transport system permease protein